jgi:hypothetical protein
MILLFSKEEVAISSSKWCKKSSVTLALLLLVLLLNTSTMTTKNCAEAWSFRDIPTRRQQQQQHQQQQQQCDYRTRTQLQQHTSSRRDFMTIATTALIVIAPNVATAVAATAAEDIDPNKERFIAARKDLRNLIDNYTDITSKGGGDAVRNILGTQGVNSNMFGIQKLLKSLKFDADDIVEYTETMDEFNAYYYQADGAAYQSMFVEHSSARSTKESCLKTAKGDLLQMNKLMDQLAVQLRL